MVVEPPSFILPLGTNGFFPSFGRESASYVIPCGDILIILDAGSGLFRLAEPQGQTLLKQSSQIHLYLSHYHLDHTFGFYGAFNLFKDKNVTVFGMENKKVFSELPSLNYFPIDYEKEFSHFRWKKLGPGNHTEEELESQAELARSVFPRTQIAKDLSPLEI